MYLKRIYYLLLTLIIQTSLWAQTELIREHSSTISLSSWRLNSLIKNDSRAQQIFAIGNEGMSTLSTVQKLVERSGENMVYLSDQQGMKEHDSWKILTELNTESYTQRNAQLLDLKVNLVETLNRQPGKSMTLLTSQSNAAEGCDRFGIGTAGSFLSVLGKSRSIPSLNIGILSTESSHITFIKSLLNDITGNNQEGLLIDAFALRKFVLAGRLSDTSNTFRVMILKFNYLLIVPPSK